MRLPSTPAPQNSGPLSVTELTARIKQVLETGFARVEVCGEVSRLTRPASGHLYFTIKDAHAAISAVIWRSTAQRLARMPVDGETFVFSGHISLYEPRGSYQLIVSRAEAVGAGKLAAEFERRKQLFAERGWFDLERKQALPPLPQHIGIITSPTAAAFEDVKKVLHTRPAWLRLTLAPALVQGQTAPASIAAAFRRICAIPEPPDLVLLVRGGGSIEDLWCFNDEAVVRAIVDCPLPVISGIGHEIDTTLADLAADRRAATPSNAAEICCPSRDELRQRLPRTAALRQLLARQLEQRRRRLETLMQRHVHIWQRSMDTRHHRADQLQSRLMHAAQRQLKQAHEPLRRLEKRLRPLQPAQRLQQQRLLLAATTARLNRHLDSLLYQHRARLADTQGRLRAQRRHIDNARQQLMLLSGKLAELDPTRVLERGYSMALTPDGRLITGVAGLNAGDRLQLRFRDGAADATIDAVTPR